MSKRPGKKQLFVMYPSPFDTLRDADVQMDILEGCINIRGVPRNMKLNLVLLGGLGKDDLWYVHIVPTREREDNTGTRLFLGLERHLKEARVDRVADYLSASKTIDYSLGQGWRGRITECLGAPWYDFREGVKHELIVQASCGELARDSNFRKIKVCRI